MIKTLRDCFTWNERNWPSFRIAWSLWTKKCDHEDFDTGNLHIGCHQRRVLYFFWRRRPQDKKNFFEWGSILKCEKQFDRLISWEDRDPVERRFGFKPIPRSVAR